MTSGFISLTLSDSIQILYQLFGGCCANVFVLESIITTNKSGTALGTVITFSQFLFIALVTYPSHTDFHNSKWYKLYLKKPTIPLSKWLVYVSMFFVVSLLNNLVLKFNISIPIHTIFRSSSTVITMTVGYLFGNKTYTRSQIVSSIIITSGTILATFPSDKELKTGPTDSTFIIGVLILLLLSVIASFMSLYNESLFKTYGNQWKESLFYAHFLGLPFFLVVGSSLKQEFSVILSDTNRYNLYGISIHKQLVNLLINVSTQYLCIRGVSKLAGKTSALTVSIVLLVRKFISLLISVVWYGNELGKNGIAGTLLVFGGAIYYSIGKETVNKTKDKED